jgi:CBS domain containing-hemolysin-like protein
MDRRRLVLIWRKSRTPIDDFAEIGEKLVAPEMKVDTLGGLVFMLAGRACARRSREASR